MLKALETCASTVTTLPTGTDLLDLLNFRPLSAAIAEKFEVTHQSPQLLVFQNGILCAHDSHHDIVNIDLDTYISPSA